MNRYEEIRLLGEGSYGKAILSKRKHDNKYVVIKEIRMANLSKDDRDAALNEANLLSSLNHPYIIKYEESFQERGCFYIVMEYANGGDLAAKIRDKRSYFTENEVLHTFIQIALAIKYIHDRKILHRDLKAQNIFLMKDGTVKLGDFGIARVLENTFQLCHTRIGTPYYLSPEICEGKTYNSKTDIWSLGCILYELCTLRHAFNAQNMAALAVQIIRGKYDPIPSCFSSELSKLISSMLTSDQRSRPSINGVLNSPILKSRLNLFLSDISPKKVPNQPKAIQQQQIQLQMQRQPPIIKSSSSEADKYIKQREAEKARELRQKQIEEILKRKKEEQKKRRQQEEEELKRLRLEAINKRAEIYNKNISELDTIGQIRHKEYVENRMAAMKNKHKAKLGELDFESVNIPEDSFLRAIASEKPEWASPNDNSKNSNNIFNNNNNNNNSNTPSWMASPSPSKLNLQSDTDNNKNSNRCFPELYQTNDTNNNHSYISSSYSTSELSLSRSNSEERRRKLMEQRAAMQANWKALKTFEMQTQELTNSQILNSSSINIDTSNQSTTNRIKIASSASIAPTKPAPLMMINSPSPSQAAKKASINKPSIKTPISSPRAFSALSPSSPSIIKKNESEVASPPAISPLLPSLPTIDDVKYNENKKLLASNSTSDISFNTTRSRLKELGIDPSLAQNEKDRKILMELDMELSSSKNIDGISRSCLEFNQFSNLNETALDRDDADTDSEVLPRPLLQINVDEAKSHVSQIHSLVSSIKSVLKMPNDAEDTDNTFEIPCQKPISHDLINKEVRFPIVSDNDSLMYRAEAMRAFLERELGIDEFITLRHEIESENNGKEVISKYPNVLPGIVVILQQLLILEHLIEDM